MEGSSCCPEAESRPDDPSAVDSSDDWRKQLSPEARQRIVNKIMDTLKRHLPVSSPEGLNELKKIAERFEEKIYRAAINQSDYLRKISLKLLSMETKTQDAAAIDSSLSNPAIGSQSPSESVNSTTPMGPADAVAVHSTTQTGHTDSVDWQEEVYQKVKSMKEIYYDQICELQQMTNLKIEQLTQTNALILLAKPSEQLEKLKQFVLMLERTKMFLQITKDNIPPSLNDKLPVYEKQIVSFVDHYRIMKLKLEGLQFQHQPSQILTTSMQQVPVQMNGVSQGFGSGLHQPYFPGVPQQNYYQPLKPSGLFPTSSQQNLETAPPQSSAQVDKHAVGIPSQPTSSVIASPRLTPIASSSPTEKHSGTSKSVSTESRIVTADQVAALEHRVAALKNRVVSLEKSLLVILCALFFAFLWVLIW